MTSLDESVAVELLLNKNDKDHPDVAIVISDVEKPKAQPAAVHPSKRPKTYPQF